MQEYRQTTNIGAQIQAFPSKAADIISRVGYPSIPSFPHLSDSDLEMTANALSSLSGSIIATEPEVIDTVIKHYRYRSSFEIRLFLKSEAMLARFLASARPKIAKYFGSKTAATVQLVSGDSMSGHSRDIVISIHSHEAVEKTLEGLDLFYDAWWLNMPSELRTRVTFVMEYA